MKTIEEKKIKEKRVRRLLLDIAKCYVYLKFLTSSEQLALIHELLFYNRPVNIGVVKPLCQAALGLFGY